MLLLTVQLLLCRIFIVNGRPFTIKTLISVLWKDREKHCMIKPVLLLMIKEEECRFNCLESCWYLSTDTTPELPSVCSCFTSVTFTLTLRHLCLLHQQGSFSFCNVEFPVIPVVPHLPASDYSASSSSSNSSYANADMFPLCCNYTFIFVGTLAEEKA